MTSWTHKLFVTVTALQISFLCSGGIVRAQTSEESNISGTGKAPTKLSYGFLKKWITIEEIRKFPLPASLINEIEEFAKEKSPHDVENAKVYIEHQKQGRYAGAENIDELKNALLNQKIRPGLIETIGKFIPYTQLITTSSRANIGASGTFADWEDLKVDIIDMVKRSEQKHAVIYFVYIKKTSGDGDYSQKAIQLFKDLLPHLNDQNFMLIDTNEPSLIQTIIDGHEREYNRIHGRSLVEHYSNSKADALNTINFFKRNDGTTDGYMTVASVFFSILSEQRQKDYADYFYYPLKISPAPNLPRYLWVTLDDKYPKKGEVVDYYYNNPKQLMKFFEEVCAKALPDGVPVYNKNANTSVYTLETPSTIPMQLSLAVVPAYNLSSGEFEANRTVHNLIVAHQLLCFTRKAGK